MPPKMNSKTAFEGIVFGCGSGKMTQIKSRTQYSKSAGVTKSGTCADFSKKASPNCRQVKFHLLEDPSDSPTKKMYLYKQDRGRDINGYVPARVVEGAKWYVEFYALDPEADCLKRKRLYVPQISPKSERRRYAAEMASSISQRLREGWSPFFLSSAIREYAAFDDVCAEYDRYQRKKEQDCLERQNTLSSYRMFLGRFMAWNRARPRPVTYVYQLKREVVNEFLDYIWIELGRKPRTRDNYLAWLRLFCGWLVEKGYLQDNPAASIARLNGRRKADKNRTVIPEDVMVRLRGWLYEHDRHFLLACYILYYCLIRPKEMSMLKLSDVSVMNGTILVRSSVSKNGKDSVVTVPDCVMRYMMDLGVLNHPTDWYLFSKDFMPGPEYRRPRQFCDAWKAVSSALKLPAEYKFYSLKDTGITDLIKDGTDLIAVRDQARHYSLEMTDLYTPMASRDANRDIKTHKSYF